jgi:hypothetical protein
MELRFWGKSSKLNHYEKPLAYSPTIGEDRDIIITRGFGGNVMKHFISYFLFLLMLMGCTPSRYQLTVDEYVAVAPRVNLGMSKEEVKEILSPSQQRLKNTEIKHSDMYDKEGVLVEILYFRSGWQHDGLTTDDEFTPYLFNDGKLVSVGWAVLGGPKTQGQATPDTKVYTHQTLEIWPGIIVY